jgi:hypothetical protein
MVFLCLIIVVALSVLIDWQIHFKRRGVNSEHEKRVNQSETDLMVSVPSS